MSSSIICDKVSFAWPDGDEVLVRLDAVFRTGRTGLIGVNGSGKSTLFKVVAGELRPQSGSVTVVGTVGYLPQVVPSGASTVSDLLAITASREALHAVERGEATEERLAAIGDDWDVEERAVAELHRLGLTGVGLDRAVATLSGGEAAMARLAALFLRRPEILLLDEPTNNLDLHARQRFYDAVASWPGTMVLVSHDRTLLEMVDRIADLSGGSLRTYGGNLSGYEHMLAVEAEAAERAVRTAESDVARQKRELLAAGVRLDRRRRYGATMYDRKREPKSVMQERKRQAQVSAGKCRGMHVEKLAAARQRLTEAEDAVRDEDEIRVELPATAVPAGRTVLELVLPAGRLLPPRSETPPREATRVVEELLVRGPERIAVLGANGAGKTTLLRAVLGEVDPPGVTVKVGVAGLRYLPQRLDLLDDSLSVVDNVRAFAPGTAPNQVRARLARFLFRGGRADLPAGALSGGERFRAVLAAVLLAEPPPQLLVLDEPTNSLDIGSVRRLSQALAFYRGALLVASHDLPFLETVGITRWLHVDRDAGVSEIGEPPRRLP